MSGRLKIAAALGVCLGLCGASASAADRVRIVNEGGIRDQWMLADGVKLAAPGYPAEFAPRGDNVCLAMGYSINPDGSTSDFSLLKAWNSSAADKEPEAGFSKAFAQASANALSQWKFKPRPEVSAPQAVYTMATMTFMGKEAVDPTVLRGNCAISNLKAFVQTQKAQRFMAGGDKHELDRVDRLQRAEQQRANAAASARYWAGTRR